MALKMQLYMGTHQLPSEKGDLGKINKGLQFWRWTWPFKHCFLPSLLSVPDYVLIGLPLTPDLLLQNRKSELQNPPVNEIL